MKIHPELKAAYIMAHKRLEAEFEKAVESLDTTAEDELFMERNEFEEHLRACFDPTDVFDIINS